MDFVKLKHCNFFFIVLLCNICSVFGQDVALYHQFNGRFDFTFVGNTLNPQENSFQEAPTIFTTSAATLTLGSGDEVEKAYLYWAGCGTGDFDVKLNDVSLTADRTFSHQRTVQDLTLDYFSAFKDVTELVQQTGNGLYTLSDLDVTAFIEQHFERSTNFAGWAIIIVYKNNALPLNQLNVYDGLQAIPNEVNITLSSLNVIDNQNAKIGFLAWEGDVGIAENETLRINGTILQNPPLNPADNAFNGTNSVTGSNVLYNMDLDIYGIQNNIAIGDTQATIRMTSDRDFVMINAIVTKLNSQLPDATVTIDAIQKECNSKKILVDYTVLNINATNPLPAGTPVSIYANGKYIQTILTPVSIPIEGSITGQISVVIPMETPLDFELTFVADDAGNGVGTVTELIENNNSFSTDVSLLVSPAFNALPPLISCNEAFTKGTFNFSSYADLVKVNPGDIVYFYESLEDATSQINPIINTTNYVALTTPKEIFIRLDNENCYSITSFLLTTKNCPPTVYNYVSPNDDTYNESFYIAGLHDIFLNYRLEIYNRWGRLIWIGNNEKEDWRGTYFDGISIEKAPDGTYYYLLFLNDIDNPKPLTGFLFLNR